MAVWRWPNSHLSRVVDGDTADSRLTRDIGFGASVTFPVRLRLARINAAKAVTPRGRDATAMVNAKTTNTVVDITTVETYKYGGPDDVVGEYVAEIVLPDGANLSDLLVSAGLAVYWDGQGPRPADS